ncbi:MAG: hypothetical protein WCC37_03410 [Candidatus Sulfotelmatobacter sp.]
MQPPRIANARPFQLSTISIATLVSLFNFGVCYFRSFIFPDIPLLPFGDASYFLNNANRIVAGRLPYRDYFAFLPPGIELTYALVIKEFGARSWIPNLMIACVAAAAAWLMTLVAAELMRGPAIALPGLLLAGFVLPGSFDATHHWFSTIAVMAAVLVLLHGDSFRNIAAVGFLCGIAAWYTQTKGITAVAGFVIYLIWKGRQESMPARDRWLKCILLSGLALTVFAVGNLYFVRAAGLSRWLYCLVVYPLRYYPSVRLNNWRVYGSGFKFGLGTIPFLFVHLTVPLVYVICIVIMLRRSKNEPGEPWDKIGLLVVAGLAMFLAIASSPGWKRLATSSPPAVILLTWLLNRWGRIRAKLEIGLGAAAIVLALAGAARVQTRGAAVLDLPIGRTAFTDFARYEEYRYAMEHTCRGQFMFGPSPILFALQVRNPAPIDGFVPLDYTRPEQVTATIQALELNKVPMLALNPGMFTDPDATPASDHLGPIRAYLAGHYRVTASFKTGDELWERIGSPGRCAE